MSTTHSANSEITGAAFFANGGAAISVPELNVNAGLVELKAKLGVVQKPQIACGSATASTSQLRLELAGDFNVPLVLSGKLKFTLDLARADRSISNVDCTIQPPASTTVDVTSQQLASLGLEISDFEVFVGLVGIDVTPPPPSTGGGFSTSVTIPNGPYIDGLTTNQPVGPGELGLTSLADSNLEKSGPASLLGDSVESIVHPLNPVIDAVNLAVTDSIAPALGLTVAGADVWGVENQPVRARAWWGDHPPESGLRMSTITGHEFSTTCLASSPSTDQGWVAQIPGVT